MQKPTQVVGRRVAAFVIDTLILAAIVAAGWFALTENAHPGSCGGGGGFEINGQCRGWVHTSHRTIWLMIIALYSIAVFVVMQGLTGKTPGKAILGIKVVNREGSSPGIGRTIVREVMWIIDIFVVGLIAAIASEHNQRLGDKVGGTFVVDKNFAGAIAASAPAAQARPQSPPPAQSQQQGAQPANWYPDPHGQARLRYWDGQRWTEHTSG